MSGSLGRGGKLVAALVGVLLSAGCSFRTLNQAPVEDRGSVASRTVSVITPPAGEPASGGVKPAGATDNAGKPGYYTVRPGDTLIRIGLDSGQNWRDIARWNNMDNPNQLEVGQVLRVAPPVAAPVASTSAATAGRPLPSSPVASVVVTPVPDAAGAKPAGGPSPAASAASAVSAPAVATASPATAPAAAPGGEDELGWIWPANGAVLAGFDELKNKGVDIGGAAGDAVLAAADGRVVYAGAGLRGYGNLIILKHNNTYLTAYAHNQTLLAKEDQTVRKGQKIAEMGNSDADRVKLHFEVRRQGKPVDPVKYLPGR